MNAIELMMMMTLYIACITAVMLLFTKSQIHNTEGALLFCLWQAALMCENTHFYSLDLWV